MNALEIKKIVGLLDDGKACGDADGEQHCIALMEDGTYRAVTLQYQKKAAYIKCGPSTEEDPWYFTEWDKCYNNVLEYKIGRGVYYYQRFSTKNTPVVTLDDRSSCNSIYDNYNYDDNYIAIARIDGNKFVAIDLD